jgi:hypothetical protein
MKTKIFRGIMTLIVIGSLSLSAHGASFNPSQARDHGAWSSLELSLGDRRFYRAVNVTDYSDMRVMVDFDSAECAPALEIQIEFEQSFPETEDLGLRDIAIRVDRKPIHESLMGLSAISGDPTLYAQTLVGELPRLISEMRFGSTLRFKFSLLGDDTDTRFAELSLKGSQAALDRAAALCKQNQSSPEDYFDEKDVTNDESAADYF